MHQHIVGWDIGGAHLKAAVFEPEGVITQVFLQPCPLWKGIDALHHAITQVVDQISENNCKHVITMTGELVDLFDNRDQGVEQIMTAFQSHFVEQDILIYAGLDGFLKPQQIKSQHFSSIASANWLASASLAARFLGNGLFIDIGSTTTDILILVDGDVKATGLTDYQRMVSGELVYTGIIRTAVMAVAHSAFFKGQTMGLMAEYFATMADVYRLTGELNDTHDQTDTADGAEKTVLASAKRLSRMTGYEYSETELAIWQQLALNIKSQQKLKISKACERQLSRNLISNKHCFVGAGVGRFLIKQIADDLGFPYIDYADLIKTNLVNNKINVADCAPAVAVAMLAIKGSLGKGI